MYGGEGGGYGAVATGFGGGRDHGYSAERFGAVGFAAPPLADPFGFTDTY